MNATAPLPMDAQRWERALGELLGRCPRGVRFVAVTWPEADLIERARAVKELRGAADALERDNGGKLLGIYPGGRVGT